MRSRISKCARREIRGTYNRSICRRKWVSPRSECESRDTRNVSTFQRRRSVEDLQEDDEEDLQEEGVRGLVRGGCRAWCGNFCRKMGPGATVRPVPAFCSSTTPSRERLTSWTTPLMRSSSRCPTRSPSGDRCGSQRGGQHRLYHLNVLWYVILVVLLENQVTRNAYANKIIQ